MTPARAGGGDKIGDLGAFVDENDPSQGLLFSGRIAEDFKLLTGTFVHVGVLRVEAIAAASPVIQDALVTGEDRPFVGILAWPALEACRRMIGDMTATPERVAVHPLIRDHVRDRLRSHNREFVTSVSFSELAGARPTSAVTPLPKSPATRSPS